MSRNTVLGANSKFGEKSPKFGKYSHVFAKGVHVKRVAILTKLVNLAKICKVSKICKVQISWPRGPFEGCFAIECISCKLKRLRSCYNKLLPFKFSWVKTLFSWIFRSPEVLSSLGRLFTFRTGCNHVSKQFSFQTRQYIGNKCNWANEDSCICSVTIITFSLYPP